MSNEIRMVTYHQVVINGVSRSVQLTVNPRDLARSLGPKAAGNKSQRAMVRFGAVKAKVLPL